MNKLALSDKLTPLQLEHALRSIERAQSIAIITHQNPDGDAMGSSLAMRYFLLSVGKQHVTNIVPTSFPDFLAWLPGVDSIVQYEQVPDAAAKALREADLVICTDIAEPGRVAALSPILAERFAAYAGSTAISSESSDSSNSSECSNSSRYSLLIIDHHLSKIANEHSEQIAYPDAASACELVFRLAYQSVQFNRTFIGLKSDDCATDNCATDNRATDNCAVNNSVPSDHLREHNTAPIRDRYVAAPFEHVLTPEFATCIYTGMMTDTGNFSYNSCQPEMYTIVAMLLTTGINKDAIYNRVFNAYSADRMRLTGYCLYHKMKLFPEYHTALITLNRRELYRFNAKSGDLEGIVNLPLQIKDVYYAVFMREDKIPPHQKQEAAGAKVKVKISFRSQGDRPVNVLAREVFHGGGHMNASGGEYFGEVDKAAQLFAEMLPKYMLKE